MYIFAIASFGPVKDIRDNPNSVKCIAYDRIPDDIIDDKVECKHFDEAEEEGSPLY